MRTSLLLVLAISIVCFTSAAPAEDATKPTEAKPTEDTFKELNGYSGSAYNGEGEGYNKQSKEYYQVGSYEGTYYNGGRNGEGEGGNRQQYGQGEGHGNNRQYGEGEGKTYTSGGGYGEGEGKMWQ
jgi:hypothetical protein